MPITGLKQIPPGEVTSSIEYTARPGEVKVAPTPRGRCTNYCTYVPSCLTYISLITGHV